MWFLGNTSTPVPLRIACAVTRPIALSATCSTTSPASILEVNVIPSVELQSVFLIIPS